MVNLGRRASQPMTDPWGTSFLRPVKDWDWRWNFRTVLWVLSVTVSIVIRPSLSLSPPLFLSSFCAYHKCNSLMVWLNFQESPDRYVKIHATHDILLKGAEEMLLRMPIKVAYYCNTCYDIILANYYMHIRESVDKSHCKHALLILCC